MYQKSLIRKYFISSMFFGIIMGGVFPFYAYFFVDFKSHILMIWFVIGCIAAGIMVGLFSFVIAKLTVLNSVKKIAHTLEGVAESRDLTRRIRIDSNDEIGILAQSSNNLLENFSVIITKLQRNSEVSTRLLHHLEQSSSNLNDISEIMVTSSKEFSSASVQLKSAMEKMTDMADISAQDMGSIAAAVTNMSQTIDKISKEAEFASEKTTTAVTDSRNSFDNVKKLEKIGSDTSAILESIDIIVKKTELIAVNANIEAVRAGSAGKAFSIVAGEVKALAEETKKSVLDIGQLINAMSESTETTTANIHSVDEALAEINAIITRIKDEIILQNVDADSISTSVDNSLVRVVSSSRRAHESAKAVDNMRSDIDTIRTSVQSARTAESSLHDILHDFEEISQELTSTIGEFKTE